MVDQADQLQGNLTQTPGSPMVWFASQKDHSLATCPTQAHTHLYKIKRKGQDPSRPCRQFLYIVIQNTNYSLSGVPSALLILNY